MNAKPEKHPSTKKKRQKKPRKINTSHSLEKLKAQTFKGKNPGKEWGVVKKGSFGNDLGVR